MNEDPSNVALRCDLAAKGYAAWLKKYPNRWETTPKRTLLAMRAIRFRELEMGREMSEPERDDFLRSLATK